MESALPPQEKQGSGDEPATTSLDAICCVASDERGSARLREQQSCRHDDRGDATLYESDLARARTSIAEAERAGAAEFGLAELASARDKVRAAELAAEDDEDQRARQLAVEAGLDADLAVAITRNRKVQELLTEVRAGLQTLDDELRRNNDADLARP